MTQKIHLKRSSGFMLDEEIKNESVEILNKYIVDFSNLFLITKQAHWNIQGPNFIAVHEMLDTFCDSFQKHIDILAERVVQLGFVAITTPEHLTRNTSFEEYPENISSTTEHLKELNTRYLSVANYLRDTIENASTDAVTTDNLAQALADLDKFVWFIEAHLN